MFSNVVRLLHWHNKSIQNYYYFFLNNYIVLFLSILLSINKLLFFFIFISLWICVPDKGIEIAIGDRNYKYTIYLFINKILIFTEFFLYIYKYVYFYKCGDFVVVACIKN